LYEYENVSPSQKLSHIVYHPFQIMKNINRSTSNIQDIIIRSIQKRRATWDEAIEMAQP
jgi:hypothetical protein